MDKDRWVLDGGSPDKRLAELKDFLKDVTMIITEEQKELAAQFVPTVQRYIDEVEVDRLLDALQAKIREVGYDENHMLNETGKKLQKLCEELDEQN